MYNIIVNYFKGFELGQTIDVTQLVNNILNVDGVEQIRTHRTDTGLTIDGLTLLVWNPVYPDEDIVSTGANIALPYFKYPYLNDPVGFLDKIEVVTAVTSSGLVEY